MTRSELQAATQMMTLVRIGTAQWSSRNVPSNRWKSRLEHLPINGAHHVAQGPPQTDGADALWSIDRGKI